MVSSLCDSSIVLRPATSVSIFILIWVTWRSLSAFWKNMKFVMVMNNHKQMQWQTLVKSGVHSMYLKWVTCGYKITFHPKWLKTPMHNNNVIKSAVPSPSFHYVLPEAFFHALLSRIEEKLSVNCNDFLIFWKDLKLSNKILQHSTINPCRYDIPSPSLYSSLHSYQGLCQTGLCSSHPVVGEVDSSTVIS